MSNLLILHYHQTSQRPVSVWQWQAGQEGQEAVFTEQDSFGSVAQLDYPAETFLPEVYFLIKEQDFQQQSQDFMAKLRFGEPDTHVWLVEGDDTLYYSRQAALTSPYHRASQPRAFDMATNYQAFDQEWGYADWLGTRYQPSQTDFRLWAPTAHRVDLLLYVDTSNDGQLLEQLPMSRGQNKDRANHLRNDHGVWFLTVPVDLANRAYVYRLYDADGSYRDSRDPYMTAGTSNGRRSVILRPEDCQPAGFQVGQKEQAPWRLSNPNQAVIMEMHIRDFSKSATSGVDESKRGKFLGACQTGTTNASGHATCFDYLKSLGINYIQLQPIFDHHQTLDTKGNYAYNWGYDPENYNMPSPIFASDPTNPRSPILDLKTMIQAYHDSGIGLIMDVVYNHTYSTRNSAFQLTVPDYYYRMAADGSFENGSGCGNETASEKEMVRKYMLDSLRYWIEEYNIDGFRFDLMGLHDVETMQAIRQMVDEIDPNILLYGEGWDMGTVLPDRQKAKKGNADLLPGIGFFNDDGRNAIKGAEVYGDFKRGFVSGEEIQEELMQALAGSQVFAPYLSPSQVLNYVEAHDNYNLNDLFWELHPDDGQQEHVARIQGANLINLLMPGMVFMQLGQEFCRTKLYPTGVDGQLTQADKEAAMNSYNAPDEVNQVDWQLVSQRQDMITLVREAIQRKTTQAVFSYESFAELNQNMTIQKVEKGMICYRIEDSENCYQIKLENQQKNKGKCVTNIQKNVIITVS